MCCVRLCAPSNSAVPFSLHSSKSRVALQRIIDNFARRTSVSRVADLRCRTVAVEPFLTIGWHVAKPRGAQGSRLTNSHRPTSLTVVAISDESDRERPVQAFDYVLRLVNLDWKTRGHAESQRIIGRSAWQQQRHRADRRPGASAADSYEREHRRRSPSSITVQALATGRARQGSSVYGVVPDGAGCVTARFCSGVAPADESCRVSDHRDRGELV